jgi:hypothetical protein
MEIGANASSSTFRRQVPLPKRLGKVSGGELTSDQISSYAKDCFVLTTHIRSTHVWPFGPWSILVSEIVLIFISRGEDAPSPQRFYEQNRRILKDVRAQWKTI